MFVVHIFICFLYSGGMPCFLRPPVLPDAAESSADYAPMSDVFNQEQNNFQGTPIMGWTSPSSTMDSDAAVVKTDAHCVNLFPQKPCRSHLEPLEISVSIPPQLPPRADARFKDGVVHRRKPRSVLLRQNGDSRYNSVLAEPYAVIPIGEVSTEQKIMLSTTKGDSFSGLHKKQPSHVYDEIEITNDKTELQQKEESVPTQVISPESEESPYAEPNDEDDDDVTEAPNCVITPPPLPPRAPSMTPPCSPKPASICSPVATSDDEYIEPEVIDNIIKPNKSLSAPPSQFMTILDSPNSTNISTNHPASPKSPKSAKEKKPKVHKRGGTLYNLLHTFKKKSQAGNVTRILPEHIPSEEVSMYQNSVKKYNLDLPNVAEDEGSELQRRLSGKCHQNKQGSLSRHRSLSPLDTYVDMHPESRPLSDCEYYEPMKLQELRQQFTSHGEYDVPYAGSSPSPAPEEEKTESTSLRKSKSETSILVDESSMDLSLDVTLSSQLSHSTDCVINDEISENHDAVSPAKSTSSVGQMDSDATVEVKRPALLPRLQKPPIGPKPQIKLKPALPPKPNSMFAKPPISPRTKTHSQYSVPKLPPKPASNKIESMLYNGVVTRTKTDIRVPEVVGDNDRKVLKPVGKAPPPPPPKAYKSSFIMVKKPPAAKGLYAVPSTTTSNSKDSSSAAKSPTPLPDTTEDKKKETVGLVVELKESDDDELEHVEYTVDSNTTETECISSTSTSIEVESMVVIQESPGKKREWN